MNSLPFLPPPIPLSLLSLCIYMKGDPYPHGVQVKIDGMWREAMIIESKITRNTRQYEVVCNKKTVLVPANEHRDTTMDLRDITKIRHTPHALLIEMLQLDAAQKAAKMKAQEDRQLQYHLSCTCPTPYQYSQHFGQRGLVGGWATFEENRSTLGTPNLSNPLGYVGEQVFFGVNMLGTFSACNWSVPRQRDTSTVEKLHLKHVFRKLFSFGDSCFLLDRFPLQLKVWRELG